MWVRRKRSSTASSSSWRSLPWARAATTSCCGAVDAALVHGEALLDEAREQVVGGRDALADDLRDVVRAHAVGVLLEQAQHLQHGARRRQAASAGLRLASSVSPPTRRAPPCLLAPLGRAVRSLKVSIAGALQLRCSCSDGRRRRYRGKAGRRPPDHQGKSICAIPGWRSIVHTSPARARGRFAMPGNSSSEAAGRSPCARPDRRLVAALVRRPASTPRRAAPRHLSPTTTRPRRAGRSTRSSSAAPLVRECFAGDRRRRRAPDGRQRRRRDAAVARGRRRASGSRPRTR